MDGIASSTAATAYVGLVHCQAADFTRPKHFHSAGRCAETAKVALLQRGYAVYAFSLSSPARMLRNSGLAAVRGAMPRSVLEHCGYAPTQPCGRRHGLRRPEPMREPSRGWER